MSDTNITKALYDNIAVKEDQRLALHPLEYAMTLDTIMRHLPSVDAPDGSNGPLSHRSLKIADIGGATGAYAFALADGGHSVHLSDLSPGLLAIASQKQSKKIFEKTDNEDVCEGILASIGEGDAVHARTLFPEEDEGTFDAVLLLGPLYHLISEGERVKAIQNALALLKPTTTGSVLFASFVSRSAHLRDIAMRDPERLVRERGFYAEYLRTGIYVRRGERNVESYHALLEDIKPLAKKAGGEVIDIVGTEGLLGGGLDRNLVGTDPEILESWLDVMRETGRQEHNLGNADHWLAVIKRDIKELEH